MEEKWIDGIGLLTNKITENYVGQPIEKLYREWNWQCKKMRVEIKKNSFLRCFQQYDNWEIAKSQLKAFL